jgi:hypothetical protein
MKTKYLASLPLAMLMLASVGCNSKQEPAAGTPGLEEAVSTATDAYVYGYPLVTMDMTRKRLINVVAPDAAHAPMGQLLKLRTYPAVDNHAVTAPNADTLYTMAWLDVSKEPYVFGIPDMGDRYFLMPMLSGWTDVFQVPGKRTTGDKAQKYAITGPGWSGTLPAGVTEYKSPTAIVWILGRIYCTGTPQDYAAVHALQDKFTLVPLSSYGKPYTPPPGVVDPTVSEGGKSVRDLVDAMDTTTYFNYLAQLMKTNPPAAADAPLVARMAKIGLVPGQEFDPSKLGSFDKEAIRVVPKTAQLKIISHMKEMGKVINGWTFFTQTGLYGTEYLDRALVTAIGLGANRPQDAIYPTSEKDAAGKEYDGARKYVMHIDKGQFPPVNGFWSLTMYDANYFFVPNTLNRYTLSSRNKFVINADGSVDLYLQADSPGKDKEANWLPAPKAKFIPMLRLYWPKETPPTILDGSWVLPAVKQVQ